MSSKQQDLLGLYIDTSRIGVNGDEEHMERLGLDSDLGWGFHSLTHALAKGAKSIGKGVMKVGKVVGTPLHMADKAALRAAHLASKGLKYTPMYYAAKKAYKVAKAAGDELGVIKAAKEMEHLTSKGLHLLPGYKAAAILASRGAHWIKKNPVTAVALANIASLGIVLAQSGTLAVLGDIDNHTDDE